MKKSISNRDLERIARRAGLDVGDVRAALALADDVPPTIRARAEEAAHALQYSVTMRDRVAMAAGVSIATVNRAYRPDARHLVRQEILEAVKHAASRLGYVPDIVARRQRANSTHIVTLCVCDTELTDGLYVFRMRAISRELEESGYHPVIVPVAASRLLPDLAFSAAASAVVLFDDKHTDRRVRALAAANRPTVLVGRHPNVPSVTIDWESAYRELTRHALKRGFRGLHVAVIDASLTCAARTEGVLSALLTNEAPRPRILMAVTPGTHPEEIAAHWRAHGATKAADCLLTALSWPTTTWRELAEPTGSRTILDDLEREKPSKDNCIAVLGWSDREAFLLMRAIEEQHPEWRIGHHVGIAGFGDTLGHGGDPNPPLTSIRSDLEALGRAVTSLVSETVGGTVTAPHQLVVPHKVYFRNSL